MRLEGRFLLRVKIPHPNYLQGQNAAVKEGSEGPEAEAERQRWNWGREGESRFQPEGNFYTASCTVYDLLNRKRVHFTS